MAKCHLTQLTEDSLENSVDNIEHYHDIMDIAE